MPQISFKIIIFIFCLFQITLQSGGHGQIPGIGLSILFIFGGLLMGGLLKVFCRFTHLPYNPLLIIVGLCLGVYHANLSFLGKASILISELNPNGIIAIFLPALLFESAFQTEWHMLKKQAGQTLILGIPCAILNSLLIMVSLKWYLQDTSMQYNWQQALLIGSILTCTDIFSFIQRLRKHGTPQKIISLIEGQSLINYCTCFLIFQFINEIVIHSQEVSFLSLIQLFIEQTVGGIFFGLLFGVVALFCLKRIIYDGILVVTIMVIFCYSVYLIAEFSVLRVSGIVAIVVYALYMNIWGKMIINREVGKYVHTFWTYIVFVAETSIFLIAGVNIGLKIIGFEKLIGSHEIYLTLIVYLISFGSRFLSIACFFKWLKNIGYGMSMKEVFIIAFTGLKGAVGISLAMLVYQNQAYSLTMRHLTFFIIAGNSLISLSINGGTAGFLVRMIGLSTLTKVEYKFYKEFLHTFQNNIIEKKNELQHQKSMEMVNWTQIDVLIGIPNYKKLRDQTDKIITKASSKADSKLQKSHTYKLEQALKLYQKKNQQNDSQKDGINQNATFDLIVQLRKRFIKASISKYWSYHDQSYISPGALLLLIQSAYFDLDTETQELESWSWIKQQIVYNIRFLSQLMKISVLNGVAKSYLFSYVSYCYDIVSSYIEASEQVRNQFRSFSLVNHQKQIMQLIMIESQQNQKQAEAFMKNYLQPSFPQIQREVVTRKSSYHVLSYFKNTIQKYFQNGQLQVGQYEILKNIIEQRSLELDLAGPNWKKVDFLQLLKKDQVFGLLPEAILLVLTNQLSEQVTFDMNEKIFRNGQIAKYVYYVKKGGIEVEFVNDSAIYKESFLNGQLIGFQSLVSNIYHSTSTAMTMVTVRYIKKTCIEKIMNTFPKFEQAFWKRHLFQIYKMFLSKNDLTFHLSHLKKQVVANLLEQFSLEEYEPGKLSISKDMIFLRGSIEIENEQFVDQIHPFMFISKNDTYTLIIKHKSTFLVGDIDYDLIDKATRFYSSYQNLTKSKKKQESFMQNIERNVQ